MLVDVEIFDESWELKKRRISFLTIHPDFVDEYKKFGVLVRCESLKLAEINSVNLRDFAVDKRGSVDAAPYGGGDGMILRPEPLRDAIHSLDKAKVIYTSPSGKAWNQAEAQKLAHSGENLIFVCGRFGGVDQRFIDKYVDEEYSLGDFVISGGELACLTMADSVIREIEGSLGNFESVKNDSFAEGMNGLLSIHFTPGLKSLRVRRYLKCLSLVIIRRSPSERRKGLRAHKR